MGGRYAGRSHQPQGLRKIHAARLAWLYVHGERPAGEIDHINGNRADNRIANLRIATRSQNCANKKGVSGVTWHKRQKKWHARIKRHGQLHHIGSFSTYEEALAARNSAHASVFGEFSPAHRDGASTAPQWAPPITVKRHLTPEQASDIARRVRGGERRVEVAATYGISSATVDNVMKRAR
jgi:hypothetical protein